MNSNQQYLLQSGYNQYCNYFVQNYNCIIQYLRFEGRIDKFNKNKTSKLVRICNVRLFKLCSAFTIKKILIV